MPAFYAWLVPELNNAHSKISAWATSKNAARVFDWLLAASFAMSLFAYSYLGSYSRYMADDYSASRIVRTYGFLGAQVSRYQGWSGRFSFTFVDTVLALIGPATPRFVATLILTLWFVGVIWAIYELQSLSGNTSWPKAALFAGFLIFATLETAPNVSQSLFWQTGALTYLTPLVLFSMFVVVTSRAVNRIQSPFSYKLNLACAGILVFIAGGFSDAYVVLQSCGLILSLLGLQLFAGSDLKQRLRPFVLVGLFGSLLALMVIAVAPGNSVRQSYFPKQFAGWAIFGATLRYSFGFVAHLVLSKPVIVVSSLLLPFLTVLRDLSHNKRQAWDRRLCIRLLLIIPGAVFILIACGTATSIYAISVMLPERARILLCLVLVGGLMLWSRIAAEYVAQTLSKIKFETRQNVIVLATVVLIVLNVPPLTSFISIFGMRDQARSFAADWDSQHSALQIANQNGVMDVAVPQIGDFQWRIGKGKSDLHLRPDQEFWINRTTATYYGLRSVRANDDVTISH